jgi:RNA polymerase sigma factor (sigma-70 family)
MNKESSLINEQQVIQACIENNPNAQRQLFEFYAPKMLAICCRYCQNREDAKDAMHEGFIKVFKQLKKFKQESKLETWITRIMIFTAIDHFKKSTKYKLFADDKQVYDIAGDEDYYIEYEEQEIDANKLRECIQTLPDGYRMVFSMYAIDGFSHKQISEELGISVGTSKSQLARARKQLQQIVRERFKFE